MTKASQIPYHIMMAVYLGLNAFIWAGLNQTVTGDMSNVYLFSSIVAGLLAVVAVLYIFLENTGHDTLSADVKVPLIQLTVPKWFFYLGSFAAMGARGYFAYMSNNHGTGFESLWGYVWILATGILFLATFPNAKVYFKTKAIAAQNRAKLREQEDARAKAS
jgi:hypothetical protein